MLVDAGSEGKASYEEKAIFCVLFFLYVCFCLFLWVGLALLDCLLAVPIAREQKSSMQHALWRTCSAWVEVGGGLEGVCVCGACAHCFTSAMSWPTCPIAGTWRRPMGQTWWWSDA